MSRTILTIASSVCLLMGGAAQGAILYQDSFGNDGLGTNAGIGGGAVNRTIQAHSWTDDGDATFITSGTSYTRRALMYSAAAFKSDTGFKLTVHYTTGFVTDNNAHQISFGLISEDIDLSSYDGYNPFGATEGSSASVYSLGVSVVPAEEHGQNMLNGLNFSDGSAVTNLDLSGDNVQFVAGSSTPVVIEILPDGSWSYSINGVTEASGVIAGGFDFTKSYRFVVYGQDDNGGGKSIQSVQLEGEAVPQDVYVSTTGDDANPGTLAEPFATIQHAVDQMSPGETCYIRGGTYHEAVDLSGIAGYEGSPITLTRYEDEEVILDGRVEVESAWALEERASVSLPAGNNTPTNNIPGIGNVYVTTLDSGIGDITQLFVDQEMMTLARWPNALAYSDGVFLRGETQTQKSSATHGEATDLAWDFSLADTGVSVAGCVGIFGSVRLITAHDAGSADFSHNTPIKLESGRTYYFIEGGLNNAERVLLDRTQEWAYDESTQTLTLWPKNNANPNALNVYARNQVNAFTGTANTKYIVIDGLDFFATKFDFDYSDDITIQNCDFTYYSISERALGAQNNSETADFSGDSSDFCENITVYNCAFRYADGTGFTAHHMDGLTFENNLVYKTGYYTCNEFDELGQRRNTHAVHAYNSKDIHYRRNTVDTTGTSQSVCFGRYGTGSPEYPIVSEYNYNTECCGLQTDVASMYIPEEDVNESVARFNWFINNHRRDFRWDGGNINEIKTAKGNFYRNIGRSDHDEVYKHGFLLKGDLHEVYNSVTLGETWTLAIAAFAGGNEHTVSRNNAADAFLNVIEEEVYPDYFENTWTEDDDRAQYDWDIPGDDANNYAPSFVAHTRSMHELLRDPDDNDFRPRADAVELIDQGIPVTCTIDGVEVDITEGYLGAAPDIGVYEYGDSMYWIGGRQEEQATKPIPSDGNTQALYDSDLMWLGGLGSISYDIYLGTASNTLVFAGSQTNNIYNPGGWANDQAYFWRIDSVLPDSSVVTGEVWSFTIDDHRPRAYSSRETVTEDGSVAVELTGFDPDGSNLTFAVTSQPAHGTLTGTAPNFVYTPDPDYFGADFLTYNVTDGSEESLSAVVLFEVEGVDDDAPTFSASVISIETAYKGGAYSGSIAESATDPDGDTLDYFKLSGPSWLNIAADGTLSGTPGLADLGTTDWLVEAIDSTGSNATATLKIRVAEGAIHMLNFDNLSAALVSSNNTLKVNGTNSNLTVTGVATNGNDYIYSVTYDDMDYDGDSTNDTVTLDILVEAWDNGTITSVVGASNQGTEGVNGTAIIGTTDVAVDTSGSRFSAGNTVMSAGETVEFTVKNLSVTLTDAAYSGNAFPVGFVGGELFETGASYAHHTVIGVGEGLPEVGWNNPTHTLTVFDTDSDPLYISSATFTGPSSNPQRWAILNVDFEIEIEVLSDEGYTAWATGYGLEDANFLPGADLDGGTGDGYDNLAEYALGMNPTNSDAGSRESVSATVEGGTNWFEYVHSRRTDYGVQGLSYLLIDSTNLVDSVSNTNTQDQILVGPSLDGYEPVTNRYLTDKAAKFIQLNIQQD